MYLSSKEVRSRKIHLAFFSQFHGVSLAYRILNHSRLHFYLIISKQADCRNWQCEDALLVKSRDIVLGMYSEGEEGTSPAVPGAHQRGGIRKTITIATAVVSGSILTYFLPVLRIDARTC